MQGTLTHVPRWCLMYPPRSEPEGYHRRSWKEEELELWPINYGRTRRVGLELVLSGVKIKSSDAHDMIFWYQEGWVLIVFNEHLRHSYMESPRGGEKCMNSPALVFRRLLEWMSVSSVRRLLQKRIFRFKRKTRRDTLLNILEVT